MVEGVWGSRKEGGNDLLLLREKKTQLDGLRWVERARMDSGFTPLASPSHCISGPLYKLNGQDSLI